MDRISYLVSRGQQMFVGEYAHNLDPKGRLAIPYRMRSLLGDGAVITRGVDGCVVLYSQAEWTKLAEKIANLPLSNAKARRFSRFFLAGAAEVEFDKQGRILVPSYLREYAQLTGPVVVAGMYNRVELWSQSAWKTLAADSAPEEDLEGLDI